MSILFLYWAEKKATLNGLIITSTLFSLAVIVLHGRIMEDTLAANSGLVLASMFK
jgi:hypothetical protein